MKNSEVWLYRNRQPVMHLTDDVLPGPYPAFDQVRIVRPGRPVAKVSTTNIHKALAIAVREGAKSGQLHG